MTFLRNSNFLVTTKTSAENSVSTACVNKHQKKSPNKKSALLTFLSDENPNYLIKSIFKILSYGWTVFQTT